MDNPASSPVIVAGVSGSPASARALRWAADEAQRRHGRLKVVLAWRAQTRAFYAPPSAPEDLAVRQQRARDGLAATVRAVLGPELAAEAATEVTEGNPERALVDSSAGADLLVLGTASGQLAGRSIGPVVRTCLSRAHCPVVVVGPEGQDLSGGESGDLASLAVDLGDDWKLAVAGAVPAPRVGD
ncbi:MAG TPA: universal stress protein [Streptosporangiaceae bacterium]|nr:universal stress protein [Streptosporangiaceae bacterium]